MSYNFNSPDDLVAKQITLSDPSEKIKLEFEYIYVPPEYFEIVSIKRHTVDGLVEITDQFDSPYFFLGGFRLNVSSGFELVGGLEHELKMRVEQIILYPNNFGREPSSTIPFGTFMGNQTHTLKKVETKPEVVAFAAPRPSNPAYNDLANKLIAHERVFQKKGLRHFGKKTFLEGTRPAGLSNKDPGLSNLSDLEVPKKIALGTLNYQNDYLGASAYHRWFPTRRHILPKHFGDLVREKNSLLQNRRVLELWVDHYITRLDNKFRIQGKKKAGEVRAAQNALKVLNKVSIDNPTPEILVNLLTFAKPGEKSLMNAIATPRTHKWRVGNMAFGFKKLFKDFPILDEYKEYLRLQVWISQYCESLRRVHFHAKPEKVLAIQAALARASAAAKKDPTLMKSLYNFLNYRDKGSFEPSLLDAIQEKRDEHDVGDSHGYEMLCRGFDELKLQKWLMDYCRTLQQFHLRSGGPDKARKIKEAQDRMNRYVAIQGGFTTNEDFLTFRVPVKVVDADGRESIVDHESLLEAIKHKRDDLKTDEVSRGFDRLCREFHLNKKALARMDVEMDEMRPQSGSDTDSPDSPRL